MNRLTLNLLLGTCLILSQPTAIAGINNDSIQQAITNYLPETYGFAKPKVTDVGISDKKRTVTVSCSESAAYIPLTPESLASLKEDIRKALPQDLANYKITILADGHTLDSLALFNHRKLVRPTEKDRFVTPIDGVSAPKGLEGDNIALWQSHGLYYQGKDEWGWQRPRLWETCEDLYTQSYVIPFLMPMLENAGAYVMSPRERDTNTNEYIIDNDGADAMYTETVGKEQWITPNGHGFGHNGGVLLDYENPFAQGTYRQAKAVKTDDNASTIGWNANIDADDEYAVYVSYKTVPNSARDAQYTVNAANGQHKFKINQRMGGGTWIYLGHFPLKAGVSELPIVELTNKSSDKNAVVTADAVKIGGGMGNVARHPYKPNDDGLEYDYNTSGYPRFTEGARYWLQWAGAPDSVYSATGYTNEYNDDYRSRGYWVNWLAGGSSVLPKAKGLNIPISLSLGFHSDAGITKNDSIIGTLGIYCTDNKDYYPGGTSRLAARDLTDLILTNITNDVRASYEPRWTRRGMWNRSYAEARTPEVPAVLLELLSHQNFADMRYGLDPGFRFTVSRAIYKAMLQFIARRDGRPYVVQPLPVCDFAISGGTHGTYTLTWAETVDTLEATATPTYYIVEHRAQDELGFTPIAKVDVPEYTLTVTDHDIHSYRIVAGNDGGVSFPSETLALRYAPGKGQVLIVNGFTRVSGPQWFDYGEVRGFYNTSDPGVAYIKDISYVGDQFEYRADIPWMANEVCGLGGSRSNYEDRVIAGNTFDYVALHGASIAAAGHGFISSSVDAFVKNDVMADLPKTVDLILGTQREIQVGSGRLGTRFKTFTAPLQQRLEAYTAQGGSVLVSGAYIATDLWNNPYSSTETAQADQEFAKTVLGYVWRSGSASDSNKVDGVKSRYKMFDDISLSFNDQLSYDCYAVKSAGSVAPSGQGKGAVVLKYESGGMPAATAYEADSHRAVAIGFPIETITDAGARNALMQAALDFLTHK